MGECRYVRCPGAFHLGGDKLMKFSPPFVGRQFLEAEDILFQARHASYWESMEAGVQCFLMAIEVRVQFCRE